MVEVEVAAHFQSVFGLRKVSSAMVGRCIAQVAEQNAYSPLRTWLKGLEWDGVGRLDTWATRVMGVEDNKYVRQVGRRALVAAVARKMEPGCVVDYMVILQGPQGVGKSSVIRELFGKEETLEYVRGGAYENKDGAMAMHGHWCVSDEELNTLGMADKAKLKAQITLRVDSYRAPYESKSIDRPRQFVWWGSTNEEEFLPRDSSGYRRFAVLKVGSKLFDFAWLERHRDQLWAEAVAAYDSGEPYSNIDEASAVAEQFAVHSLLYEQVEQVIMEGWMKGPTGPKGKRKAASMGKEVPIGCQGESRPWIKLAELAAMLERRELTSYQMAEMGRALVALGFVRLPQLKWEGRNQNVVYLWAK
jgi:predicted P-loop ATPase